MILLVLSGPRFQRCLAAPRCRDHHPKCFHLRLEFHKLFLWLLIGLLTTLALDSLALVRRGEHDTS